jgi:hypothetical protein
LVEELELLSDFVELGPEVSDFADSDFFSVELDDESDELEDSELLFDEPLDALLAASRLSVR